MKPSNVVATPISGVYKAPLLVELDCPSVSVAPTSVATSLSSSSYFFSRNISKVGNNLFFNAQYKSGSLLGIYDINNNRITTVPCPYSPHTASFIYVNGYIYIMGGNYPKNNRIMKYSEGVVTVLEQTLPQAMGRMSCNAIGRYIYIIGGDNTGYLSTIYRLDTTTDTIELMPYELRVACYESGSTVYQNRYIYVVGGYPSKNKVQIIDTEKGTVSLLSKDLPVGRTGAGAMVKDDFLYVFGGYTSTDIKTVYKKYLLDESDWVLDTQTLAYVRDRFGYTSDEKGYYHIIGGVPVENGRYYETGRFGVPSSDVEIRYTQTEDGTIPADPTETDTLYTTPIELTSPTKHNIKAKAFYVGE